MVIGSPFLPKPTFFKEDRWSDVVEDSGNVASSFTHTYSYIKHHKRKIHGSEEIEKNKQALPLLRR